MCRDIGDIVGRRDRLVAAAWIERQLADQLALEVDHSNASIGVQKLDHAPLVGPAEADFVGP